MNADRALYGFLVLTALLLLATAFLASGGRYVFLNVGGGDIFRGDRWTGDIAYVDEAEAISKSSGLLEVFGPVAGVALLLLASAGAWVAVYRMHRAT